MKYLKFIIIITSLLFCANCASLPPESIMAQEKIGNGIETARRNQILLIEKFAAEAKSKILISFQAVIPNILKTKKADELQTFTSDEVKELLIEYGKDLETEFNIIDKKRYELEAETDSFFINLQEINKTNLELLKSVAELNQKYKDVFDKIKQESNTLQNILDKKEK